MKKLASIILIFLLLFQIPALAEPTPAPSATPTVAPTTTPATTEKQFPEIHAEAAMLMDLKSGRILYSKNETARLFPASTTKILTGIIALEKCNLTDVITAPSTAIDPITREDSSMGILKGEQLTIEQLIYGMLVHSANDAANTLAIHISGSLDEFAKLMNEKAKEVGAVNSNFVNAHGFHDDNHYTTAADLAAISRYAMTNEKFREIVATPRYEIPVTNKYTQIRYLSNTNNLLTKVRTSNLFYKPAIGIKTGFTSQAGNCLVAAAKKDDTEFLSVLLKCPNVGLKEQAYSFSDTKNLFEYAFEKYKYRTIAATTDIVSDSAVYEAKGGTRVALTVQSDVGALLPIDADIKTQVTPIFTLKEKISAPIQQGDTLGTVSYSYNGETIGTGTLISTNSVERDNILFVIHGIINVLTSPFLWIPLLIIVLLIVYIRLRSIQNRKKRRGRLSNYPRTKY